MNRYIFRYKKIYLDRQIDAQIDGYIDIFFKKKQIDLDVQVNIDEYRYICIYMQINKDVYRYIQK